MTIASKTRNAAAATLLAAATTLGSAASFADSKPTVILVHGAFAEAASWNGVASRLIGQGYPVIAAANPLRGVGLSYRVLDRVLGRTRLPAGRNFTQSRLNKNLDQPITRHAKRSVLSSS
jgi:alpha-beta hydrolase superfamily lysophospholipase